VCQDAQGCRSGGILPASQTALVPQGATYMRSRPPVTRADGLVLTQRANPYLGPAYQWWNVGTSSYHALNVSLTKRAAHGLAFKAAESLAGNPDLAGLCQALSDWPALSLRARPMV